MTLYIVRVRENDELVGVYSASSLKELFWLVDECASPNGCDYAKLPNGGFYWPLKAIQASNLAGIGNQAGSQGVMMEMVSFGYYSYFTEATEAAFSNLKFKPMPRFEDVAKKDETSEKIS